MDNFTAENIGKKSRALKHINKVLKRIDRYGSTQIALNCTGISFDVTKNDAFYLQLQVKRAELVAEIGSYEIIQRASSGTTQSVPPSPRCVATPVGASESPIEDEPEEDRRRRKKREYNKKYRETHPEVVREYNKRWREKQKNK